MSDWGGFTEDELRRMKENARPKQDMPHHRQAHVAGSRRGKPMRGQLKSQVNQRSPQSSVSSDQLLSSAQKLSVQEKTRQEPTPRIPEQQPKKQNSSVTTENKSVSGTGTGQAEVRNHSMKETQENVENKKTGEVKEEKAIIDDEEILNLEMSNLDKFRSQQKQIEELNKKKRELLASAILERQKKAKAESVKLMRIQKELDRLDQMLTVDVSLIRDRIEDASRCYMDAQKRFDKAEKEYIEAKMTLFNTQEKKEQLTEHLYTVIQQNEIRKAQKLKELMEKLEMESEGDTDVSDLVKSITLPHLTVINAMPAHKIAGPVSPPSHPQSPPTAVSDKNTELSLDENKGQQLVTEMANQSLAQREDGKQPVLENNNSKQLSEKASDKSCSEKSLVDKDSSYISLSGSHGSTSKGRPPETAKISLDESPCVPKATNDQEVSRNDETADVISPKKVELSSQNSFVTSENSSLAQGDHSKQSS